MAVAWRGFGAGAVPVNGDEGRRGVWRTGPRVGGAIVAGGVAEEARTGDVVGRIAWPGPEDPTARGVDGPARVRRVGHHWGRRKEKGGQINAASAVLVPSFSDKGFITW